MMTQTGISTFDRSLQKTQEWIKDMQDELKTGSADDALHYLRAVLHALRDLLMVDEAVQLSAQLPILLKGIYFDAWDPSKNPVVMRTKDDFFQQVMADLAGRTDSDIESVVRAAFRVLKRKISSGEIEDVKAVMSRHLIELWA